MPCVLAAPPVQEEDGGDEDDGGGGGGKRWIRVWPVSKSKPDSLLAVGVCVALTFELCRWQVGLGQYGDNTACFLAKMREVREIVYVSVACSEPIRSLRAYWFGR